MTDGTGDGGARGGLQELWQELKRRRVVRTSLWYGGACGALIQGADLFVDYLGLPAATVRTLAVLAICGFPVVVMASWAYDLTVGGGDPGVSRRARLGRGVALGGAALLSAAAALFFLRSVDQSAGSDPAPASPSRVAVLPLEAPESDPELVRFADDLHVRLIDRLSPSGGIVGASEEGRLRVISRAGILPFGGGQVTTDSIRRALDVGTLVEGNVERDQTSARVRLRVLDAGSGEVLAVHEASAPSSDLVALTDSVGAAVEELRKDLGLSITARRRLLETGSREAYRAVTLAQAVAADFGDAFRLGGVERARRILVEADSLFAQAARLDPTWAEPVVERGLLVSDWTLLAAATGGDPRPSVRQGLRLASEALLRDPGHAGALYLRGSMRYELARLGAGEEADELLAQAEQDLRMAARTSPRPAPAHRRLSEVLAHQDRLEEALLAGERAYEEDPYLDDTPVTLLRLFEYSLELGRDAEAARWCQEGGRRFPIPPFFDCALLLMAWSDPVVPDPDSAAWLVQRELQAYPEPLRPRLEPRLQALLAATLARAGHADSARAALARARAGGDRSYGLLTAAAGVHLLLDEPDSALAAVDTLLALEPDARAELRRAPELRSLHGDPRLEERLARGAGADPGGG